MPQPHVDLQEWKSGTGRVIRVGDLVTRGTASKMYRVKSMKEFPDRVEVSVTEATGSQKGKWRTFLVDDLHQVRRGVEVR